MVEAPSNLFDDRTFEILFIIALNTPLASTPGMGIKIFIFSR